MISVENLCHLIIVGLISLLITACTDSEYTEIRFQEFPEQYQQYDRMPWEMLEFEEFSRAYDIALKDFPDGQYLDDYISEIFVVSTGNRFVATRQGNFIFMVGCKPHCCTETRLFILFDPEKRRVWTHTFDFGVTGKFDLWLGQPDEKIRNLVVTLESMVSGM